MTAYNLDGTLLDWGEKTHSLTLGIATTGICCFGGTGSGKTSGVAELLRSSYLTPSRTIPGGMGGLVLCSKVSEREEWVDAVSRAGRTGDLRIFDASGRERFDWCEWESSHGKEGGGQVINTVLLMSEISIAAERASGMEGGGGSGENAYFTRTLQHFLTALIFLILVARQQLTIQRARELAGSAPQTFAELKSKEWHNGPLARLLAQLAAEYAREPDKERRADIDEIFRFWTGDWPRLNQRPKSIVETMFTTMISHFLQQPLRRIFTGGNSTIRPEDCFENGQIIIVDLPIQELKAVGSVAAQVWKHCFQKAVMRRSGPRGSLRPTFLWADECQNFVVPNDAEYQAVARSSAGCTVYLTQSIQSLSRVLGEDTTEALLGNLQTRFFAQSSSVKTNAYASNSIGSRYKMVRTISDGGSTNHDERGGVRGDGRSSSVSFTEQLRPFILPSRFLSLRNGGAGLNNYEVDTVVFSGGKLFQGEDGELVPFKELSFRQYRGK